MESGETRNLSDYLGVLRRRWKLIFFVTVLAAAIAVVLSVVRSTTYEATANLQFIDPGLQANGLIGSGGTVDFFPANEAGAGAARVTREDVLKDASRALGGNPTPDQLKSDTTVTVSATNNLVIVTTSAGTADNAAKEANQLAISVQNLTRDDAKAFYKQKAQTFPSGPAAATLRATVVLLMNPTGKVAFQKGASTTATQREGQTGRSSVRHRIPGRQESTHQPTQGVRFQPCIRCSPRESCRPCRHRRWPLSPRR